MLLVRFIAFASALGLFFALGSAHAQSELPIMDLYLQQRYLDENAQKPGVYKRLSGLQIKIIERGDGALPNPSDRVVVHYEGRFIDGTVFDSSYETGEPVEFPIAGVIRGWQEALILMTVGSKWELVIPAKIGYGADGAKDRIPPGATLVFTVELLGIK